MIDWNKELEEIFKDPLFDDVTAPRKPQTSSDRLIDGFLEVCDFVRIYGYKPTKENNPTLFNKLNGILKSEERIERCRPYDDCGILPPKGIANESQPEYAPRELTEEEQLEQIMNDPLFDDIDNGDDLGLFDIPDYMRQRLKARKEAEYVGSTRPCEDVDKYEPGF